MEYILLCRSRSRYFQVKVRVALEVEVVKNIVNSAAMLLTISAILRSIRPFYEISHGTKHIAFLATSQCIDVPVHVNRSPSDTFRHVPIVHFIPDDNSCIRLSDTGGAY